MVQHPEVEYRNWKYMEGKFTGRLGLGTPILDLTSGTFAHHTSVVVQPPN